MIIETPISSANPSSLGAFTAEEFTTSDRLIAWSVVVLTPCVIVAATALGLKLIWGAPIRAIRPSSLYAA